MNKMKQTVSIFLCCAFVLVGCSSKPATVKTGLAAHQESFLKNIDLTYSFNLAKKLETFKSNPLGYRTAGSKAELATGDMLVEEMKAIGLQHVTKDKFTLDTWEFEKAEMAYTDASGKPHVFQLGGYQTNFDTNGLKSFELIYANKGTMADLEAIDVKDKLVLIEINQREDWWVSYPALEAKFAGAAAVIAYQNGGYGEIGDDALNAQDICGPADAPIFSISKKDATLILNDIQASKNNEVSVSFDAKSTVGFDGTSYNIVGTIPGKDPDSMVLLSAHYDSYFTGFQDDNAAIALMLGIAKATIASGYQPEKTLVFTAMAAEEWGLSNTRYDWSTGAFNQIFKIHPEWVGKVVANINFELPAYEHTQTSEIRSSYEFATFLNNFKEIVPLSQTVFDKGINVVYPTRTWSDDFSMSIAGVPAIRNDFEDSEFMKSRYHSQFDTEETYNADVFEFHHKLYGLLMLEYDRTAVTPLDFTTRLNALEDSLNKELADTHAIDIAPLSTAINETITTAQTLYEQIAELNKKYAEAILKGKDTKKILAETRELNSNILAIFKYAEDNFTRLTWEDSPIFPHEHYQTNIEYLQLSIEALQKGDVVTVADEYLWKIDNNWYAYSFSKKVFNYFTDYAINQSADRLAWGVGRIVDHIDLYDTILSLQNQYDSKTVDVSNEIAVLTTILTDQVSKYKVTIDAELIVVKKLQAMLAENIK